MVMPPNADDERFFAAWQRVEDFIDAQRPEFILLQCGADSIDGDPMIAFIRQIIGVYRRIRHGIFGFDLNIS